ncbi:ABC transporter permease [Oleiphilus messinensis]|uniref:ABC transporter permease n=1 Tax=Oleiphilus messinensis TaxID=141451 RepID=A0A1Y0IG23_9GAMM|nr:FtsX-like permease family protein [Oleiphilus messinensis]ARU59457.1 ABC transporter permease [Oleiphilus messinensis]
MSILMLAGKSLGNRKATVILTVSAIAVSVALLLAVERTRTQAKAHFANTISGTDMIVGARTGPVQLLLYSVFHIGNATNNISWESYQEIATHRAVKWSVPLSLGDSHKGFRVLGTETSFFDYYHYGQNQALQYRDGHPFNAVFDAVIGAEVAAKLGYEIGDKIILAHGAASTSFAQHSDYPFTITGILKPTSTPVDRTVLVSLAGIEAIHQSNAAKQAGEPLDPEVITAALVGLKSKIQLFQLQRFINEYSEEPLLGIAPGVTLYELWNLMGVAEQALITITWFVVATGLIGMLAMIIASLNERRREMAILRAIGARPIHIFLLLVCESGLLALLGAVLGVILLYLSLFLAQPYLLDQFGLMIHISPLTLHEWQLLAAVITAGLLVGIIPSIRAFRMSLADGMTIRI